MDASIDKEIARDERVLWKGRPATGIRFRTAEVFLIPLSLLWGGFAIFWEVMVLRIPKQQPIGYVFPLFGLPFVLVGLYLMFGRFLYDAKSRENTEYALTADRVIIKSGIFSKKVMSLNLKSLADISLTENADGTGTITFGESTYPFGSMMRFNWPGMVTSPVPSFEWISNAHTVYDLILKVQKGSAS